MSFTINVTLVGLHALVPSEPVRQSREGQRRAAEEQRIPRLRVLVPDARRADNVAVRVGDVDHQMHVCPHDPFLLVEQAAGPARRLQLGGHHIELVTGRAGDGVTLRPTFGGIAEIASAVAAPIRVDTRLLDGPDERLVGSLRLDAGIVSGNDFSPLLYDFRNPRKVYRAFLQRGARIEIPVAAERAEIRLAPFGGGPVESVELTPAAGRFSVDVTFSNLCEQPDSEAAQADADFARYYDLLADYGDGPRFVPFPVLPPGEVLGLATGPISGCIGTVMPPADI
jgi:hypothetical protein